MNIYTIFLTSLAFISCDTSTIDPDEIPTGGGCGGDYEFSIDQVITSTILDHALGDSDDLGTVTCEQLCQYYESFILEMESCDYSLDFETLPEDFDTLSSSDVVGTIQCSGSAELMCDGRRPIGYVDNSGQWYGLGAHFAHVAQLEAASIIAFTELARQLKGWNAPEKLIYRCLMAAQDEVHHARAFMELAKEFGEEIPTIIREEALDDIFHVALHNAVEGCVFETWAALKAHYQSIHCDIPTLKKLYARVATDETRHGQLAWDLHHWFMSQLSQTDQNRVINAQKEAFVRLQNVAVSESEIDVLGSLKRNDAVQLAKIFIEKISA